MALPFSRLFGRAPATPPAWIDIAELRRRLDAGEPLVLIDVRQAEEFSAPPGHLPGALNLPLPELPGRIAEAAAHQKSVVLVCKTDRRSARAADLLISAGMTDIAILRGGTDGWHQQGLKLEP